MSTIVETFLLIEQPRQRLGHWQQVLAPLDSSHAPPLANVIAYYDPNADNAVLNLRYDRLALGDDKLAYVIEVALLAEIGMVQPAELSDGDRKRFIHDRLSRCTLQLDNQRAVVGALVELVRLVREAKMPNVPKRPTLLGAIPLKRAPTAPPVASGARGTRDDMEKVAKPPPVPAPKGTRDLEPPAPPRNDLARADRASDVRLPSPHVIVRGKGSGSHAALRDVIPSLPPMSGVADRDTELSTRARRMRSPSQLGTEPYLNATDQNDAAPPSVIYARYLRSGRWLPIRIGALSLKGAALLAGALPRLHDHVDVALAFGGHRALVRGSVGKVSTEQDVRASGAATFSVNFELDEAARRQLTTLLTAARAANITIKAPPARVARRLPVEWPVSLGTTRGAVRAQALDMSRDGMFIRPANPVVVETSVSFSVVLDDGGAPVAGRARVVRHVNDATARTAGLTAGYGLLIVEMGDADRVRWLAFVARVEKRADKRVLVGASPARLAELQATLSAAGYVVTGGTDPGALVQLARSEGRPVDAALIDANFIAGATSSSWLESLFTARDVPCLTLHGDPRGARQAVDKLLGV